MIRIARGSKAALAAIAVLAAGPGLFAGAAHAQGTSQASAEAPEQRLRRIEGEIKALQRKVFPEGAGKFFVPEIGAPTPGTSAAIGTPASGAVTDLLARMDALEGQVTRLTGQVEEGQNRLAKLEAQMAALQPGAAGAAIPAPAPAPVNGATIDANTAAMAGTAPARSAAATTPAAPLAGAPAKPATPPASRVAAVQAVEKPQTGDAADDDYTYGFRLWTGKFYPEAQQALLKYVNAHPRHAKMSYGRNLLGRAYLDDGMPGAAAQYFVQNYNTDPRGDRAPDSLLYLAVAMTRLKQTDKACLALQELGEKYPAVATGRLAADAARARTGAKCN